MEKNRKSDLLTYQNKTFDELYIINTLVQMTKLACSEKEYKGQYYGSSTRVRNRLSEERNEYITMLTLATDRLSSLMKINLSVESEISDLQQYTDNCCRQITT